MGNRITSSIAGAATHKDWRLTDGGEPVPLPLAEKRSSVCRYGGAGSTPCPNNWQGDWWTRITEEVALAVLSERAEKFRRQIVLADEEKLGTCEACLCPLQIKVLVPIEHIVKHTTDEVWNQLPTFCWIKQEGSALRESK